MKGLEKFLFSLEDLDGLDGPILIRADINLPVTEGRVDENNPRIEICKSIVDAISEETDQPIIVVSHQGRRGQSDFIHLDQHAKILNAKLIRFPESFDEFPEVRREDLGKITLLDNIRMWNGEKAYTPDNAFVHFCKKLGVSLAINDAIPCWHREDASLMSLPEIAKTKVGWRSAYELNKLDEIKRHPGSKAIVIGGAKPEKITYLESLLVEGYAIYTTGIPGQAVNLAKGHNLGKNKEFIERNLPEAYKTVEIFKKLLREREYRERIFAPVDFVVSVNGEIKTASVEEGEIPGIIKDIGPETVDLYVNELKKYAYVIRAGPSGVYEEGFFNGGRIIKSLIGKTNLVILGGDSASEMKKMGLYHLLNSAGVIQLISGGSAAHDLARYRLPSLDRILEQKI